MFAGVCGPALLHPKGGICLEAPSATLAIFFTPSPLPQDGQEELSGWQSRRREVEADRMWDLSSQTSDGNQVPCIGGQSPNHWTPKKVPKLSVSQLRSGDPSTEKGTLLVSPVN